MKVSEILAGSTKAYPSIEIVPPLRGITKDELLESIAPFMEFSPKYINVTSHRDEFEYREEADGTFSRHLVRNRISETTVCAAIMSRYDVEVVPHLICGGSTKEEIESRLDNLEFLGISNIVALRGDSMTGEKRFTPTPGGYRYASELVEGIRKYQGSAVYKRKRGMDSSTSLGMTERGNGMTERGIGMTERGNGMTERGNGMTERGIGMTERGNGMTERGNGKKEEGQGLVEDRYFCIGVGAYPEKHFEAANIETDILNLKKKVDAGADYIITQMFFDNKVYYNFVKKCRAAGITVPIIPGLKPLSTARQVSLLPESFSLDIPVELTEEIARAKGDKDAVYQIGKEWCAMQCKDLIKNNVPAVHFYTMGKSRNIVDILRECF